MIRRLRELAPLGGYTHIVFIDPYKHYLLANFNMKQPFLQMLTHFP
jgi:hypothetical protein